MQSDRTMTVTCSETFDLSFLQTTLCQPCLHSGCIILAVLLCPMGPFFSDMGKAGTCRTHTPGKVSSMAEPS